MDYEKMAVELLEKMMSLRRGGFQRHLNEYLQGENFVLCIIASHKQKITPSHISKEMNVSSARIAVALNNLENKGMVTRQINNNNRRQILVEITKKGKEQAELIHETVQAHMEEFLSLLGEKDAQEYLRITKRLADIVDGHNHPLPEHHRKNSAAPKKQQGIN